MKCEKCGGEWIPPKDISVSLMNCPFCGASVLNADKAKSYQDMGEFLQYLVSLYGSGLYENQQKLNNLIADLYQGDERMKRVYRRAIFDDSLSKRIYDLSLRPLNEREVYYNQLVNQFVETNFYTEDFGKQVVNSLISGLQLAIMLPVFTDVTEDDGEWKDEYGVRYSADRKKLIRGEWTLKDYDIRVGTIAVCDEAFARKSFASTYRPLEDTFWYQMWGKPDSYIPSKKMYYYDSRIKNLSIPNTVLYIGEKAFSHCRSLINVTIPDSVTSIGKGGFRACTSLTNMIIPNSVKNIEDKTFMDCVSLRNVIIPHSVTNIGDYAFAACKSLTSIIIPDSVTNIGKGAFNGCNDLVITLESNKHFIIIDDMLYTSNKDLLIRCNSKKKKDVVILESVKNIGDYAFVGCKLLANITIPNSVINIGESAFSGCESLTNITIPDSVTNIGGRAFDGCKLLADIIIPNSVTSIGLGAFWNCNSLNNIYVHNGSVDKFKKLLPENLHNKLIEI